MYLVPDGEEQEIASAAGTYLAETMPIERLHGSSPADMDAKMRQSLGKMGWFALSLSEELGGSGLSAIEHSLFFQQVGQQCGPIDVLAQCLSAMTASDAVLRSSIIDGTESVALAVTDGEKIRIFGSRSATLALRVNRDSSELFSLADTSPDARQSLDPATSMQLVDSLCGAIATSQGSHVWAMGQLATAAMLVGIAEATLEQIVEYAKVRETFGRKIGSWQAVRHPCADMAIRVEAARAQLYYAATAMNENREDAEIHLDAAKYLANRAALANVDSNIQLHGGIGVTDEHHAHLFLKHALVLAKLFGAKRNLLDRLLHSRVDA